MKNFKKIISLLLVAVLLFSFCACSKNSSDEDTQQLKKITVSLDWTPNTNHTGLYVALANGYYKDMGLDVSIVQPPEGDAITACASGKVEFAIGNQDILAPVFGSDDDTNVDNITAVAALLQHNTSCLAAQKGSGLNSAKDMQGKQYLTWQTPIDLAIVKSAVEADGGDFSKVEQVPNVVTDEAQDFKANPEHINWIFYGWGGINCEINGVDIDTLFIKDLNETFDYYTPVLVANNQLIADDSETVKAFLSATKKGYEYAIENPEKAAQILIDSDDTGSLKGSEELVYESQKYLSKQYIADAEKWGYIEPERWNDFYNWVSENNLTDKKIPENTGFSNDYLE